MIEHEKYIDPEIIILSQYQIQAEMVLKLANWEVNFLKKMAKFFDGNTLKYFR